MSLKNRIDKLMAASDAARLAEIERRAVRFLRDGRAPDNSEAFDVLLHVEAQFLLLDFFETNPDHPVFAHPNFMPDLAAVCRDLYATGFRWTYELLV